MTCKNLSSVSYGLPITYSNLLFVNYGPPFNLYESSVCKLKTSFDLYESSICKLRTTFLHYKSSICKISFTFPFSTTSRPFVKYILFWLSQIIHLLNMTSFADVDECSDSNLNACDKNAACTNTVGSYTCRCNVGYFGAGSFCTGKLVSDLF